MLTVIIFIGLIAVLGAGCYCLFRWVLLGRWHDWQQARQEEKEDQRREQRKQALRYEALDSVLSQIGQSEERGREAA